jgi:hypothetical protein
MALGPQWLRSEVVDVLTRACVCVIWLMMGCRDLVQIPFVVALRMSCVHVADGRVCEGGSTRIMNTLRGHVVRTWSASVKHGHERMWSVAMNESVEHGHERTWSMATNERGSSCPCVDPLPLAPTAKVSNDDLATGGGLCSSCLVLISSLCVG